MIGTLSGAVALLYRAQLQALKDQLALQAKYTAEREQAANYWRDKYFEADSRLDRRFEVLAAATAQLKSTPRARPGPGQEQGRRDA